MEVSLDLPPLALTALPCVPTVKSPDETPGGRPTGAPDETTDSGVSTTSLGISTASPDILTTLPVTAPRVSTTECLVGLRADLLKVELKLSTLHVKSFSHSVQVLDSHCEVRRELAAADHRRVIHRR